ncbi:nucleotidyltransferase family protein [Hyphomicrobium facile]|uniref:Molybdenum cofactor cytidylyltransferase n=1 Tax=Hyphomicrobium facile TaxID=51670 RepID=A0A1I7MVI2_9HYPH|nr:nucleotidyltransferase family protein [Hyphomicrobium facile]SFV26356.1 molybdenum cofactor cytidylyltransferase [Hyphomicrobium facile]
MKLAAVILAAGSSSRFENGHKLLVEIDGTPMVRRVCSALAQSKIDDIILVTGGTDDRVAKAAGQGRWRIVENPDADDGLSTSLRTGLRNIDRTVDGLLIALADMPGISSALVDKLVSAFEINPDAIVFPASPDGRRGHPIIWPRSLFAALDTVTGDRGGREILAQHQELWRPVACDEPGAFADIDTRADLATFVAPDQPTRRK